MIGYFAKATTRGIDMSTVFMKIARLLACFTICYLLTWVVAYTVVMEGDFRFLGEYFILGWRGGGEYPTFIQTTSLVAALAVSIVATGLSWRRSLRERK